jgi:hypothetical protein
MVSIRAVRTVSLRMAKLRHDPQSGSWRSRKEIPKDIRDAYWAIYRKKREEIFHAKADCPVSQVKVRFSEWQSEIDSRFAALRAKQRGEGRDLTQRQADALAGDWYRWFTSGDKDIGAPRTRGLGARPTPRPTGTVTKSFPGGGNAKPDTIAFGHGPIRGLHPSRQARP